MKRVIAYTATRFALAGSDSNHGPVCQVMSIHNSPNQKRKKKKFFFHNI